MYKQVALDNFYSFASMMHKYASDGNDVYAILYYDDAIELMRTLLLYRDVSIGGLEIAQFDYNGYDKEYFVSLTGMTLDIEPAWGDANEYHDAGYLWYEADLVFASGDVHSSLLKDQDPEMCYEVVWMDEDHNGDYDESMMNYDDEPLYVDPGTLKRILFHFFHGL